MIDKGAWEHYNNKVVLGKGGGGMRANAPIGILDSGLGGYTVARVLQKLLDNRLMRFLSTISMNLYIWHQVLAVKLKAWHIPAYVNEMPNKAGEQPWQMQYTLLCFIAPFVLSVLITYFVEKPCARYGRKWLRVKGK